MSRPLDGVTILDFTRVFSGPFATLMLSDLGARVLKVEHPNGGDDSRQFGPFIGGTSGYFETLNRGKESLAVDYRSTDGQALLHRVVRSVDVVIENFRPGQMARYGLDYSTLSTLNSRLVYTSISGFGQNSPYRERGCYDIVAQAMSGLMSLTGTPDRPLKTGPSIADAISGLTAATGLLAALWSAERTGKGAHVDIAMVDAVFACLENALAMYSVTVENPSRTGNTDTILAPFDSFKTTDGWVVIGVGNDRLWRRLAALLNLEGDDRFSTNDLRLKNYEVLRPFLQHWCEQYPTDRLLDYLHTAGIPSGSIQNIEELSHDAHFEARGMLMPLILADNRQITVPGSVFHMTNADRPIPKRAPLLGEHTESVLREFGLVKG
jgi:CoA:oxalate CoA-transferase